MGASALRVLERLSSSLTSDHWRNLALYPHKAMEVSPPTKQLTHTHKKPKQKTNKQTKNSPTVFGIHSNLKRYRGLGLMHIKA